MLPNLINNNSDDVSETDSLSLKDSPFCAAEIKKLCSHKAAKDDYLIIGCLDQGINLKHNPQFHFRWLKNSIIEIVKVI